MFVNKTYLMYYFAIFFSVQAENEWADPPYSLTQEAIDRSVILEDKKLFIPEDLSINTPVLNLYYNKSTYVSVLKYFSTLTSSKTSRLAL